jgi:hypothetical protein
MNVYANVKDFCDCHFLDVAELMTRFEATYGRPPTILILAESYRTLLKENVVIMGLPVYYSRKVDLMEVF